MKPLIACFFLLVSTPVFSQTSFSSVDQLLTYAIHKNISVQTNQIRFDQAKKAKLAALLNVIEVTGNLLNAQFTNNTKLGVNVFPAEAFGGQSGTFKEIQTGVQYTTSVNTLLDIKVLNLAGWENLRLSKINIDLTQSNNLIALKTLKENIAINYYNIVNLQKQLDNTQQNLTIADTLYQLTLHQFEEGLAKQQDVNDSKVNLLNTQESARQLAYLIKQYYITLQLLCEIPDSEAIIINHKEEAEGIDPLPTIALSTLSVENNLLKQSYALSTYKNAKAALLPTISMQFSNAYNLFNTELKPLSGHWINSNYVGLKVSLPIPTASAISRLYSARYDYQIAQKNTEQAQLKAPLEQAQLANDYQKALSQVKSNKEIVLLRTDTYAKNKNLYAQGLMSLDNTLNSYGAMINAQFNLITSEVNLALVKVKISINNKTW